MSVYKLTSIRKHKLMYNMMSHYTSQNVKKQPLESSNHLKSLLIMRSSMGLWYSPVGSLRKIQVPISSLVFNNCCSLQRFAIPYDHYSTNWKCSLRKVPFKINYTHTNSFNKQFIFLHVNLKLLKINLINIS